MITGTCAVCGQPGHRYGTTDPEHKYDGVACVNGLLPLLEEAEAEVRRLRGELVRVQGVPGDRREP